MKAEHNSGVGRSKDVCRTASLREVNNNNHNDNENLNSSDTVQAEDLLTGHNNETVKSP